MGVFLLYSCRRALKHFQKKECADAIIAFYPFRKSIQSSHCHNPYSMDGPSGDIEGRAVNGSGILLSFGVILSAFCLISR